MNASVTAIPPAQLLMALIPALAVLLLLWRWSLGVGEGVQALARMAVQLIGIGYVLTWLLRIDDAVVVGAFLLLMLPTVNSLLAVGVVSLPGMMTGQILSGVDPLLAVRYQVLVMAMIFAASGLAAGRYLAAAVGAGKNKPR